MQLEISLRWFKNKNAVLLFLGLIIFLVIRRTQPEKPNLLTKNIESLKRSRIKLKEPFLCKMKFTEYYPSGKYSDLTIRVDDEEYYAHKMVLESSSDLFRKLFEENPSANTIRLAKGDQLTDNFKENFHKILLMVYGYDVTPDQEILKLSKILGFK